MNRTYTDDEIMAMYRGGDRDKALSALMQAYQERLYWHIRRFTLSHDDTDDLLQETFIKIWAALPTFREDSKLLTWAYRIAT
ncbi:MAG: RNA polymerase sigma factor, partial [Bacteroidales bacterium]|nr:RNA polymerase sigma factor [Bacteroidales bacterium]